MSSVHLVALVPADTDPYVYPLSMCGVQMNENNSWDSRQRFLTRAPNYICCQKCIDLITDLDYLNAVEL